MNRYVLATLAMALVLAGPVGCGKKEVDELKAKVVTLDSST